MKLSLPPRLVKPSLDAHSAIGLVVGALMYLICLTGTIAALAETFERWEQPGIPEFVDVPQGTTAAAIANYRERMTAAPESLWVLYPTQAFPRLHVSDGEEEWFTDSDGRFLDAPHDGWIHMVEALHVRLHLPETIGFIIVSSIGVMLLALILSGIAAHPRIFRDAFTLRLGGSERLEQADWHNRLSVWGLPFHLMIAITGAFYGLVGVLAYSAANAYFDGDLDAMFDAVYGKDPVLTAQARPLEPEAALSALRELHPQVRPLYLVVHKMDTEAQYMEIAAEVPGRLAWSEIYRFDAAGTYIGSQELTSGPAGRQFLYSLYRIHFGYFGTYSTRILWALLGLSLTIVSVTGVNVWLKRRGRADIVDRLWSGTVWGSGLALVLSAIGSVLLGLSPFAVLLTTLAAALLTASRTEQEQRLTAHLKASIGGCFALLALGHTVLFWPDTNEPYVIAVNITLLIGCGVMSGWVWRAYRPELSASH